MAPERQHLNEKVYASVVAAFDHERKLQTYYALPWWRRLAVRRPRFHEHKWETCCIGSGAHLVCRGCGVNPVQYGGSR